MNVFADIISFFVSIWDILANFDLFITLFAIVLTSGIVRFFWRLGGEFV